MHLHRKGPLAGAVKGKGHLPEKVHAMAGDQQGVFPGGQIYVVVHTAFRGINGQVRHPFRTGRGSVRTPQLHLVQRRSERIRNTDVRSGNDEVQLLPEEHQLGHDEPGLVRKPLHGFPR